MTISMYKVSAPIFVQFLTSLSTVLDKATAQAEAKKIDPYRHPGHSPITGRAKNGRVLLVGSSDHITASSHAGKPSLGTAAASQIRIGPARIMGRPRGCGPTPSIRMTPRRSGPGATSWPKLAIWARRLAKKASAATRRASGRSCAGEANPASISPIGVALMSRICSPRARAASGARLPRSTRLGTSSSVPRRIRLMSDKLRSLRDIAPGTSLLPMPIILSLFACLIFAATLALDFAAFRGAFTLPVWLSVGNVDDARALLSAIIGAVSTVLALIFSVSLLVFSAAATQFGPRLMQRFLRDRMMQFTLGLFVATFFHALFTFIAVRQHGAVQFVPQLTVITTCAMVVLSFTSLVIFNNNIASSIQTNNVLPGILEDLKDAIIQISNSRVQQAKRTNGVPKIPSTFGLREIAELQELSATDGAVVLSAASGFVQIIQYDRLASKPCG